MLNIGPLVGGATECNAISCVKKTKVDLQSRSSSAMQNHVSRYRIATLASSGGVSDYRT